MRELTKRLNSFVLIYKIIDAYARNSYACKHLIVLSFVHIGCITLRRGAMRCHAASCGTATHRKQCIWWMNLKS